MKIIDPSYETILGPDDTYLQLIELAGRTCYKSEDKITKDSAKIFVKKLIENGHEAMIECAPLISVKFICNRGFSHEMVRHRLCSFAQESTRYCNYSKDKHNNEITVIRPSFLRGLEDGTKWIAWCQAMSFSEEKYLLLLHEGCSPQEARGVLPIDLKTELFVSANVREWRHILKMRTSNKAHPSMQQLMRPLLKDFQKRVPILFDDIIY